MKLLLYPAAFMANIFSMTFVMIGLALFGKPELAADFGIVHGATVALIFALSGNARSLILSRSKEINATAILQVRFLFLLPLGICAFYLSTTLTAIPATLAALLVWRRICEWLAEVFLSEHESAQHRQVPVRFVAVQAVTMVLVLVWLVLDLPLQNCILFIWGLAPLFWCLRLQTVSGALRSRGVFRPAVLYLLPHFGSTTVIGVSVYVFRLFLVLLVGKSIAGDLFSAFALGGIFGSVLAQALGPTLAMHSLPKESRIHRMIRLVSWLSVALGLALVALAVFLPQLLAWTRKAEIFWVAVGLSLIGGVVMAQAQQLRYRILLHSEHKDVFGADVISNILLIAVVPLLHYVFGLQALAFLYLISALLAWVCYACSEGGLWGWRSAVPPRLGWLLFLLPFAIIFPLFFQIRHVIFNDTILVFYSHGSLKLLPLPLAVVACCAGIALLGEFSKARLALSVVFITFLGMLFSSVIAAGHHGLNETRKLILLVQYVLPMFALVLGMVYGRRDHALKWIAKAFLFALLIVVPAESYVTVARHQVVLSPSLVVFSVYQQLEYVPVIFVAAFVFACFTLREAPLYRMLLLVMAACIGFYAAISISELAICLLFAGVIGFAIYQACARQHRIQALCMVVLTICSFTAGFRYNGSYLVNKLGMGATWHVQDSASRALAAELAREAAERARLAAENARPATGPTGQSRQNTEPLPVKAVQSSDDTGVATARAATLVTTDHAFINLATRLDYWKIYGEGIMASWKTFLFGHAEPPDRDVIPSAHDYYLDFIYNFGAAAIFPLLGLIGYTLRRSIRHAGPICADSATLALTVIVFFLIFADNVLKVGMREPYSGIFTYFLWGVLLSTLLSIKPTETQLGKG